MVTRCFALRATYLLNSVGRNLLITFVNIISLDPSKLKSYISLDICINKTYYIDLLLKMGFIFAKKNANWTFLPLTYTNVICALIMPMNISFYPLYTVLLLKTIRVSCYILALARYSSLNDILTCEVVVVAIVFAVTNTLDLCLNLKTSATCLVTETSRFRCLNALLVSFRLNTSASPHCHNY